MAVDSPGFLIAADAAALGGAAAYGGVIETADGERREVKGLIQRTALPEVTAALAVLQHLPQDADAVLQVDAQLAELQSVLVITHPRVVVTRIPRNSSELHARAHELARSALRTAPTVPAGEHQRQRVALYSVSGVQSRPVWAVAFEVGADLLTVHGAVPLQATKALTLQLLHDAARSAVPASHWLLKAGDGQPNHPRCQDEDAQTLKRLRSAAARELALASSANPGA
ncbi:hypothetical protein [Deinococcus humi]|uniref:Uncharacterized protein n=1 Tax=Deinococcus humi TaxID=662880 RepID=A0A7W8JYY2_9DEIO|nr:hypothetical protein [Deinococcus humi]MBB5364488.1 hypothetical protein [Deinococcus humi]